MSPVGTLCTSCGICCDGTLFVASRLQPGERMPGAVSRGWFSLPCDQLKDRCCSIYEQRPQACRNFECKLVGALRSGAVTLDEGLAIVAEAHRRLDAATAAVGFETRAQILTYDDVPEGAAAKAWIDTHFVVPDPDLETLGDDEADVAGADE